MKFDAVTGMVEIEAFVKINDEEYNPRPFYFRANMISFLSPVFGGDAEECGAKSQITAGAYQLWIRESFEEMREFMASVRKLAIRDMEKHEIVMRETVAPFRNAVENQDEKHNAIVGLLAQIEANTSDGALQ